MNEHHEMITRFRDHGLPLCPTLEEMLDEAPRHRTRRRGCGLTQATRMLASRINQSRTRAGRQDLDLFAHWGDRVDCARIRQALNLAGIDSWRHWDQRSPELSECGESTNGLVETVRAEARRQATLRELPGTLEREESVLLAGMIRDLVLPVDNGGSDAVDLKPWPEKLQVGSCPTAEKCYLELAHGFMPRKACCNQLVDGEGRVVMLEKVGMGDDHSCISLVPLRMNGVRLPPGSLLAVRYDDEHVPRERSSASLRGSRIRVADCDGFRMLRLTTLAVLPQSRERAFSAHFQAQVRAGLFEPESTELHQLRALERA